MTEQELSEVIFLGNVYYKIMRLFKLVILWNIFSYDEIDYKCQKERIFATYFEKFMHFEKKPERVLHLEPIDAFSILIKTNFK